MPLNALKSKRKAPQPPSSSSRTKSASSTNYATITGSRNRFSRMVPNSSFGFYYQDEYSDANKPNERYQRLNLILHNGLTDDSSTRIRASQIAEWIKGNISDYQVYDDIRLMACHSARSDGALSLAEEVSNILKLNVTGHVGKLLSMDPKSIDSKISKFGEEKMFSILEKEKRSLIKKSNPFASSDPKAKEYDEYNPITFYGKSKQTSNQ